jgi:Sel1 repeat
MKTGTLPCSARWHTWLCGVFCLLAVMPFGNAQGIPELKSKAQDGDVQAQLALAKAYYLGDGVVKDETQAAQWWEKAAEHGDAAAQMNLGIAYSQGAGVPKNYAAALRWYTKAADQGNAAAQYNVGQAYNLGNGVEKDTAEAARWWHKAAEQGLAKAQYNLGMAYRSGVGVEKDNVQAYFWVAIAASSLEQGFVKDYRDKVEAVLTPAQVADVQERIRKWEEAHPALLNSLPSVPQDQQQTQTEDHPLDQQQARAQNQPKRFF